MKGITRNGERNKCKRKMREQVALPPNLRKKHEERVHLVLKFEEKNKSSVGIHC